MAGITPTAPAFASVKVAPKTSKYGPTSLKATYISASGPISSSWDTDGRTIVLNVSLPVGVKSGVIVVPKPPGLSGKAVQITENGKKIFDGSKLLATTGINSARDTGAGVEFSVANGAFSFTASAVGGGTRI